MSLDAGADPRLYDNHYDDTSVREQLARALKRIKTLEGKVERLQKRVAKHSRWFRATR